MMRLVSVLALALGVAACGGSGPGGSGGAGDGSCDIGSAAGHDCVEYTGPAMTSQWQQSCTSAGGTWSANGCSHTNAVGGCKIDSGGGTSITTWYYSPGFTEAVVKMSCGPGMFVSP